MAWLLQRFQILRPVFPVGKTIQRNGRFVEVMHSEINILQAGRNRGSMEFDPCSGKDET